MSTNPPSRRYGVASGRFWRNVTLIALAHVALIAGLIRWSSEARSAPDAQNLVWLSGAEDLLAEKSEGTSSSAKISAPSIEPEQLKPEEAEKERASLTQAKSEIDLATPQPTPKPAATPATKPQPPPKVMRKTVPAKTLKSSVRPKSSLPKPKEEQTAASNEKKKSQKTVSANTKSSSVSGSGKTGSMGKGASGGSGSNASEFGWYGNMLHDRFYSAWIQPTTTVASGIRISTLVRVRIDKNGQVSRFEIIKPSENVVVNESVAAIAKRVTDVDSPPTGLIKGDHYDVKINFELTTNRETVR
ncbi:MAG: TonB C-terminal domain-containing protein [Candidatus Udaeobacter sp.]